MKQLKKVQKRAAAVALSMLMVFTMIPAGTMAEAAKTPTVTLKTKSLLLYKGQRKTVKATVKNKKAGTKLVWKSSNKKVAAVSQKGSVKAVKSGKANITVTVKGTKNKAVLKVTVGEYAKKISLESAASVFLKTGKTSQIKASVSPSKALYDTLSYSSLDTSVATVDKEGLITAKAKGTTQILVRSKAVDKTGEKVSAFIFVSVSDNGTGEGGTGGGDGNTTNGPLVGDPVVSGKTTTYTLDKSYEDYVVVSITMGGKTWSRSGKVSSLLNDLAATYTTYTNSDNTIQVKRERDEEWWTATDLTTNQVLFRVKAVETLASNENYGEISVEEGTESVSVSVR